MKKQILRSSAPACSKTAALTLLGLFGAGLICNHLIAAGPPYMLQVVAYLGDAAPGGGAFTNRLKPTALNNRGQLAFAAEPDASGKQAIFLADSDWLTQIVRFGQSAPGGGVFATASGDIALNEPGDLAFGFELEEGQSVFRWSHQHQTLSAVIVPNVTPVPDGSGVFVGAYGYPSINNQADIAFLGNVTNPPPTSFTFVKQRTGILLPTASAASPQSPSRVIRRRAGEPLSRRGPCTGAFSDFCSPFSPAASI
jgi:hypothetical protein